MARLALESGEVGSVVVVPSYAHPFRKELAPYDHRLEMARLAFGTLGDRVEVSKLEEAIGGVSYTIDTVRALAAVHPGRQLRLIVGSDILPDLPQWKSHEELCALAPLLVFQRAKTRDEEAGIPAVSSTELRALLHSGHSPGRMLPDGVENYIRTHGLYGTGAG